jgi:hypothetical protein
MLIPEIIIYKSLNSILDMVSTDYTLASDKTHTILYDIFNKDDNGDLMVMGSTDNWYERAVKLFVIDTDKRRNLEVFVGYNLERNNITTIHILLPNETKGKFDAVGLNDQAEIVINDLTNKIEINKSRTKNSVYHLMVTSDNSTEVLITYYYLQALLLMFSDHFELKGLVNMQISGADVIIQQELSTPHIFHRNLSINFDYEYIVKTKIPIPTIEGFKISVCADLKTDYEDTMGGNGA